MLPEFQPGQHGGRATGGGEHEIAVLAETSGHAIVEDHAVVFEHDAVAALARRQLQKRIGIEAGNELGRVRALNIDFAECRGIQNTDAVTHRQTFAIDGLLQGFAGLREIPRALPLADILEFGALPFVPAVQRGVALGIEQVTHVPAGKGAERRRRIGGTKDRRAGLGDILPQRPGQDRDTVNIAEFALIRAQPQGRVAFDMLHRLVTFAGGQLDIGRGDIELHIDKLLGRPAGRLGVRRKKQRLLRRLRAVLHPRWGRIRRTVAKACAPSGGHPGALAF